MKKELTFSNPALQKRAVLAFKQAVKALQKSEMRWCIVCGTLLGAVRDKGFIPHDSDIDFAIFEPEKIKKLKSILKADGFTPEHTFGTVENGSELSFRKNGVKVDFFMFYTKEETVSMSVWKSQLDGSRKQLFYDFPSYLFDRFSDILFLGLNVPTPSNPRAYLCVHYGNWERVEYNWNWSEDPRCLRI